MKLSNKDQYVLQMLAAGPLYGLDLVAESKGLLHRGTVYVHLAQLEENGLIKGAEMPSQGDIPGRRQYTITDKGRQVLVDLVYVDDKKKLSEMEMLGKLAERESQMLCVLSETAGWLGGMIAMHEMKGENCDYMRELYTKIRAVMSG